jgi:RHH-type proline utilization regulon transcriptional repressor/proline dehydrogenase/delta 1-pyrroline-5-carboxylate dehydrogenase
LAAAAGSDARAWTDEFSRERDRTGLRAEANVFRYRRLPGLDVRIAADALRRDVLRVLLAGAAAEVPLVVSVASDASEELIGGLVGLPAVSVRTETDNDFASRVQTWTGGRRLRTLGTPRRCVQEAAAASGTTVLDAAPCCSGRRELLSMVREQTISWTRHRFGHLPDQR